MGSGIRFTTLVTLVHKLSSLMEPKWSCVWKWGGKGDSLWSSIAHWHSGLSKSTCLTACWSSPLVFASPKCPMMKVMTGDAKTAIQGKEDEESGREALPKPTRLRLRRPWLFWAGLLHLYCLLCFFSQFSMVDGLLQQWHWFLWQFSGDLELILVALRLEYLLIRFA